MAVNAINLDTQQVETFTNTDALHTALASRRYYPVDNNGQPLLVQEIGGGYLIAGAPINVWMGEGWYDLQLEILQPLWESGEVPRPPSQVQGAPVKPIPQELAQKWEQSLAGGSGISGNTLLMIALGVGALFIIPSLFGSDTKENPEYEAVEVDDD